MGKVGPGRKTYFYRWGSNPAAVVAAVARWPPSAVRLRSAVVVAVALEEGIRLLLVPVGREDVVPWPMLLAPQQLAAEEQVVPVVMGLRFSASAYQQVSVELVAAAPRPVG